MKKAFVYILKDRLSKFYVGSTTDVPRRVKQHESGHTQTTNRMESPTLVLVQEFATLAAARKVEKKIKDLKHKDYIEKMVVEGFIRMKP